MRIRQPMRAPHESNVTTMRRESDSRAGGVWSFSGSGVILADPEGPATLLVPTEQVLLLAVELPLKSHARRLAALPYAVEDRIADPVEAVHLALGAPLGDDRYLVGVVRHDVMARWVEEAEAEGLGRAAMVPDALTVMCAAEGGWNVDLARGRALVRSGDGTGFACSESLLRPAWEAAGRPPVHSYGEPLSPDIQSSASRTEQDQLHLILASYDLDLRQGRYARRAAPVNNVWRRLGWIVAAGVAAHVLIAAADTVALGMIADHRARETKELIATLGGPADADPASVVGAIQPSGGGGGADLTPGSFVPLVSRVAAAIRPFGNAFTVRTVDYQANSITMDLDSADPALAPRILAALQGARLKASVNPGPTGGLRITASVA
ncbi:type II secretion system protein GspL [Sphingomonas sp.]|uniref:type II secretion system protein GspL n=1 Tax=Sphingomonas sp. TaxID=28214 RepID=UPI0025F0EF75|nr:type II secretion system protein GspL [Sphingomonas sp.]